MLRSYLSILPSLRAIPSVLLLERQQGPASKGANSRVNCTTGFDQLFDS